METTANLLEFNLNPEIANIYRKMKSTNLDSLTQENLTEIALIILKKIPEKRTATDIKLLVECTKQVKFFQNLSKESGRDTHENCCKYMTLEPFQSEETIFELGSAGFKFYIILKGSVGVWVNIPRTIEIVDENGETQKIVEHVLTEVTVLKAGSSFGELALIDNKPRAATIICKEQSDFAVLDKKSFNIILKENEQRRLYAEVEFLRALDILSSWSYNDVKYLYYHTQIRKFGMKSVVYKESDEAEFFYIIRKGEFQIDLPVELPLEGSLLFKRKFEKYQNKYSVCSRNTIKKYMKLAILSRNEYFGFDDLISGSHCSHRVTCISEYGELSVLGKKEFLRRFLGDAKTHESLMELINQKNEIKKLRTIDFMNIEMKVGLIRKPTIEDEYQISDDRNNKTGHLEEIKITEESGDLDQSIQKNFKKSGNETLLIDRKYITNFRNGLPFLNERKKSVVLKKILKKQKEKNKNATERIEDKNQADRNKKASRTFHDQGKSILRLLDESEMHGKRTKTEASQILTLNETNNLVSYAEKHDFSMNLHRKLKSLALENRALNESGHITSKIDTMQELRSSFKPLEVIKLKAFKQLNQRQKEIESFMKFTHKKRIEDLKDFFVPRIVQRSLNEQVQINRTLARIRSKVENQEKKTKFLNLLTEQKLLEIERRRADATKFDYLKREHRSHLRVKSLANMNRELLPLKYNTGKYEKKKTKRNGAE